MIPTDPQYGVDQQSLKLLAAAAQGYLDKAQDDLGRSCVGPQIQLALNNLNGLITRHYAPIGPALAQNTETGNEAASVIDPAAPAANDDVTPAV